MLHLSRSIFALVFMAAVVASLALPANGQHGGMRPGTGKQYEIAQGKTEWVKLLIKAVNLGSGVEAWETHDLMQCRMVFTAPAEDQGASSDAEHETEDAAQVLMSGVLTYDISARRMRFDFDTGLSILVARDGLITAWNRNPDSTSLTRDDIPHDWLETVRALAYLIAMPLRMNDDDVEYGLSGYQELEGEPLHMTTVTVPQVADVDADVIASPQRYPSDWYMPFAEPFEPYRLRVMTYRVFDRSRRLEAFPKPRAVYFDNYVEVDGVAIPTNWSIHSFSRVTGVGDRIASAKVSDISFMAREDTCLDVPAHAIRMK